MQGFISPCKVSFPLFFLAKQALAELQNPRGCKFLHQSLFESASRMSTDCTSPKQKENKHLTPQFPLTKWNSVPPSALLLRWARIRQLPAAPSQFSSTPSAHSPHPQVHAGVSSFFAAFGNFFFLPYSFSQL